MSAVKTGIPAAFASLIAAPTALESQGVSTIADTFLTMNSFTCPYCHAAKTLLTNLSLDATLQLEGKLVWHGTVTGQAKSVPCVDHQEKLVQATQDAIGKLRAEVIRQIASTP